MILPAIFIALVLVYSLFSRRLERTVFTAPVVFTVAGMIFLLAMPHLREMERDRKLLLLLSEVALVLILFTDASRTDLKILRSIKNLPIRLLTTGMVLTIFIGTALALLVFRSLSLWEAGIIAAILAPTDAGLGQMIVNSPRVPLRIRQALNVEAGLNDGMSVPFLMCFIALTQLGIDSAGNVFLKYIVEQIGLGALIGLGIGAAGGWLLDLAHRREWMNKSLEQLGLVAIPLLCALASEPIGASMFIAAFVAGLAIQWRFKEAGTHSVEFTEQWGQVLNYLIFFLFGIIIASEWAKLNIAALLYAVLSLTVVRMLPVAIALAGTGLSRATVLFMGWFGPRGLASIVLGLVFIEQEAHLPGEAMIKVAIGATVLLSIFAHGITTLPGIRLYADCLKTLGPGAPDSLEQSANEA
jgi:sodium/hydrogen antiporter